MTYKPPKDYKPAKADEAAAKERSYIFETLSRLNNSMTTFLHSGTAEGTLTGAEWAYYTITSLLSAGLLTALDTPRGDPSVPETLSLVTAAIRSAFANLKRTGGFSVATGVPESELDSELEETKTFLHRISDMHTMAFVRETALAIKLSAQFVVNYHEKEVARDKKNPKAGLHKDALAEMKALEVLAGKALVEVKGRVQVLKEALNKGGWLDRVLDLTLPEGGDMADEVTKAVEDVVDGREGAEEWVGKMLESWNVLVKGWGMVRME